MTDWVRAKSKITVSVAPRKEMTKSKKENQKLIFL